MPDICICFGPKTVMHPCMHTVGFQLCMCITCVFNGMFVVPIGSLYTFFCSFFSYFTSQVKQNTDVALHYAVWSGVEECVALLLSKGTKGLGKLIN